MARDGLISVKVTDYNNLIFRWWEISQSEINNTTNIGWELILSATEHGRIVSSVNKRWSVTIDGKTMTGQNSINIYNNSTLSIWRDYQTLTHGADGLKTFAVSFSLQFDINFAGVQIGTKSGSGSFKLNALNQPKSLILGATSVTMGTALSISVSGASSDETYDIDYSFNGRDYERVATAIASSTTWTVPTDLANYIPDALQGVVTLRCTTRKTGIGSIGTRFATFNANVPEYWPSIDSVTFEEANSKVAAANLGFFVQSLSKLKFNIAASGKYGSTITNIKAEYQGKTYTGEEWTSAALALSGANVFQITITDSRGRTQSGPKTVQATAYNPPEILNFSASRIDAAGNADTEGKKVKAPIRYTYSSLSGKNTVSLKLDYKKSANSSWSSLWSAAGNSSGQTTALPTTEISADYIYDIRLTVTDVVGSKITASVKVPAGAVIFDIKSDGKGLAFFNTCTKDGVEIAGQLPNCPIEIENGTALYNLMEPGYYTAASASVINGSDDELPPGVTGPFSLEVRRLGLSDTVEQTLYTELGYVWARRVVLSDSGTVVTWYSWIALLRGEGKTLWSGSDLMNSATKQITLKEPLSAMPNGIVLVFSRYESGVAQNYLFSHHFVSKHVGLLSGLTECATVFNMNTTKYEYMSSKYLYISDTYIRGHADNNASGTGSPSGITYNNAQFALRYVIGV